MLYKIECWTDAGELIWNETVFSPIQIEEAVGRMENHQKWKDQFDEENNQDSDEKPVF
jgi:hypothetical protein